MKIIFYGVEALENELRRLDSVRFDAVERKQLTQMLNRARRTGGTPVDSGELRLSSEMSVHEVGYTAEYASHVEYGHRTANHSFIRGQRFLKENVEKQKEIYKKDLVKTIKKG